MKKLVVVIVAALFLLPVSASAQTAVPNETLIRFLMQQIASLQAQIAQLREEENQDRGEKTQLKELRSEYKKLRAKLEAREEKLEDLEDEDCSTVWRPKNGYSCSELSKLRLNLTEDIEELKEEIAKVREEISIY